MFFELFETCTKQGFYLFCKLQKVKKTWIFFCYKTNYYRVSNEEEGHAMTILLEEYETDAEWTETCFLGTARRNIDYFQRFSEDTLLDAPSSKSFATPLNQAMFSELTESWQRLDKAAFTRQILPTWHDLRFQIPYSKVSETVMIKSCFAQNFTLNFKHKHSPTTTNRCRLCKAARNYRSLLFEM